MAAHRVAKIPLLVYGTAWKKGQTRDLVRQAINAGFRGVDTAAQPKHYQEHLVGEGIRDALKDSTITRADLYIQSKFSPIHGQDLTNMPYNPADSLHEQVKASVASSLHNLRHTSDSPEGYIDCLVLHSPYPTITETREVWQAMESHVPHSVRTLGISNIYHLPALRQLYDSASIKPTVVQNRFYAQTGYDQSIRAFCAEKGITYQSFWTLTANPQLLRSEPVARIAEKVGVSLPVSLYSLVLGLGRVSVLNGTTNSGRMRDDVEGLKLVNHWKKADKEAWQSALSSFKGMLQS